MAFWDRRPPAAVAPREPDTEVVRSREQAREVLAWVAAVLRPPAIDPNDVDAPGAGGEAESGGP